MWECHWVGVCVWTFVRFHTTSGRKQMYGLPFPHHMQTSNINARRLRDFGVCVCIWHESRTLIFAYRSCVMGLACVCAIYVRLLFIVCIRKRACVCVCVSANIVKHCFTIMTPNNFDILQAIKKLQLELNFIQQIWSKQANGMNKTICKPHATIFATFNEHHFQKLSGQLQH